MKRTPIILSLILVLCLIITSCNSIGNTETSNVSNVDINGGSCTSSSIDAQANKDIAEPLEPYEKHGNKVYFAFEEKNTDYYVNVTEVTENDELLDEEKTDWEKTFVPSEIPKDEKSYVMLISTYEELLNYVTNPNVDETIFEKNYVICLKEVFSDGDAWIEHFNTLGYFDFCFKDGKYEISVDCYYSVEGVDFTLEAITGTRVAFLAIPKAQLEFAEGVHELVVNQYLINNKHNGISGAQIGEPSPPATNTHWYVKSDSKASLPKNPTSWVVQKNSSLEKQLGLDRNGCGECEYRAILYLPNEPQYDFIITEKEIKNGNLYLTVEQYSRYTNDYLSINDVKFYDLYIQDTSELAENFDVYILVKTVK